MAFKLSDEQRKVLESSEEGKAVLAGLEASTKEVETATKKAQDAEAREKALQDRLMSPEYLELITGAREAKGPDKVEKSAGDSDGVDFDSFTPKQIVQFIRQQVGTELAKLTDSVKNAEDTAVRRALTAEIKMQLDDLRDEIGDPFEAKKDQFLKLADDNPKMRPKQLWKKLLATEETAKLTALAEAQKAEEKKAADLKSQFTENPDQVIAAALAGKKGADAPDAAFEAAWKASGAEAKLADADKRAEAQTGG